MVEIKKGKDEKGKHHGFFDYAITIQMMSPLYAFIKSRAVKNNRSFGAEVRYLLSWLMVKIENGEVEI